MKKFVSKVSIIAVQFIAGNVDPLVVLMNEENKASQSLSAVDEHGEVKLSVVGASISDQSYVIKHSDWLCRDMNGVYFVLSDKHIHDIYEEVMPVSASTTDGAALSPAPQPAPGAEELFPHDIDKTSRGYRVARPDLNPTHNGYLANVKIKSAHLINEIENIPSAERSEAARWKNLAITQMEIGVSMAEKACTHN